MAQQTINIGTLPNDGTGDTLRDAGDKANDNFTELYTDWMPKTGGTFSGDIIVPAEAYGVGWNGSNEAPTKNDVYDKIEDILDGVTFTGDIVVPDEAYDATAWNGSNEAPTKNAVRDKIESVIAGAGSVSDAVYGAGWDGVTTVAPSKNAVYDKIEAVIAGSASVSDTAYGGGWNGDTTVAPSKNAVYDKIEAVVASIPSAYAGGVQSMPVLAAAMTSRTTNGAAAGSVETTTNKIMLATLDFDASTIEYAQFMFPTPKSWNESTVTAQFIWTAASGSGDVIWGLQGIALSDDDAFDSAFGTAQEVTDTLHAANDQHTTSFTSAITIGGTPNEGDIVVLQVYRKASDGSDTLGVDAKLVGIRLNFTTNAADDS